MLECATKSIFSCKQSDPSKSISQWSTQAFNASALLCSETPGWRALRACKAQDFPFSHLTCIVLERCVLCMCHCCLQQLLLHRTVQRGRGGTCSTCWALNKQLLPRRQLEPASARGIQEASIC